MGFFRRSRWAGSGNTSRVVPVSQSSVHGAEAELVHVDVVVGVALQPADGIGDLSEESSTCRPSRQSPSRPRRRYPSCRHARARTARHRRAQRSPLCHPCLSPRPVVPAHRWSPRHRSCRTVSARPRRSRSCPQLRSSRRRRSLPPPPPLVPAVALVPAAPVVPATAARTQRHPVVPAAPVVPRRTRRCPPFRWCRCPPPCPYRKPAREGASVPATRNVMTVEIPTLLFHVATSGLWQCMVL